MADEQGRTFEDVHERLSEIVDEVSAEDISLDDALKLYEEAVKLGLSACDLSEQDLDAFLATEEEGESSPAEECGATPPLRVQPTRRLPLTRPRPARPKGNRPWMSRAYSMLSARRPI